MIKSVLVSATLVSVVSCSAAETGQSVTRQATVPMAWDHRDEAAKWTETGLQSIATHGQALVETVPEDIKTWCPKYEKNGPNKRAAFWVGLLSALARHESTWRPEAVGGGGQWFGLTQISPATARGYGCKAKSGQALLNGSDNISCAVRIAAHQVSRDAAVVTDGENWRGMARDWAPFRSASKRQTMAAFTSVQPYCQ